MKNLVARVLTLVFVVTLIFGSTVLAQRIPQVIKVNIPFDFTVNGQPYAAGTYFWPPKRRFSWSCGTTRATLWQRC